LLALASCGGGGDSPPGSKLFITDGGNHAFVSIINAAPTINSTFTIDRTVQGSSTGLGAVGGTPSISSIPSIALDAANDRLYAATQTSVVVFNNASTANGNVPFSRQFTATVTKTNQLFGVNFYSLSLDTGNNRLYPADPAGEVHIFDNASGRTGPTTPERTITPDLGAVTFTLGFGVAIDATKNMLYVGVATNTFNGIVVFNNASTASTLTTPLAPDRQLALAGAGAFHLDAANDRLYVAQFNGLVLVFDNASLLVSGTPMSNRIIDLLNGVQNFIFVDTSRNKLYAVANNPNPPNNQSVLNIIDNASTANEPNVTGLSVFLTATNIRLSAVAVKP